MTLRLTLTFVLLVAAFSVVKLGRGQLAADDARPAFPSADTAATPRDTPGGTTADRDRLVAEYSLVPRDEIMGSSALLAELQARYRTHLERLRDAVRASGARMVVAFLTPEFESDTQKALEPFIRATSADLGVPYVMLTDVLRGRDAREYTQLPRDGHWSDAGTTLVANAFEPVLREHVVGRSNDRAAHRLPTLIGDLAPGQDVILDGGKNLPYRLQTNSQGLRLGYELTLPKAKPRVLILGDSQIYCPFLDNPATIAAKVQALHPELEVVPAANLGYSVDDFDGLFRDRARLSDPDLVIVQTNGGDVFDLYFSHRNVFSRAKTPFAPTSTEAQFYATLRGPAPR